MVLGTRSSLSIFRSETEPTAIFNAATSLQAQLQHVEERCVQAQQHGERLRSKRVELLEVLRVFEMIEDSEKEKTKDLEVEVTVAEQKVTQRYTQVFGNTAMLWKPVEEVEDVFGPTSANYPAENRPTESMADQGKPSFFRRFGTLAEAKRGHVKTVLPEFCKQMVVSMLPSGLNAEKENRCIANEDTTEDAESYSVGPRAPLLPREGTTHPKRYPPSKKRLVLEKAKQKASEHWKSMPHKARRKLRAAHAPTLAAKKTLVYTGEAIKSVANGFGMSMSMVGGLWTSQQATGETKASDTWPEELRSFLNSGTIRKTSVRGEKEQLWDDMPPPRD